MGANSISKSSQKKYPQFNELDIVIAKPLRSRGALGIKIFRFDYDIYIILLKHGDKYKLKSLYYFIHEINIVKRRWYKPYELRKITPQQALKHLNSPLVQAYLYQVYKTRDAVKDMKEYIQKSILKGISHPLITFLHFSTHTFSYLFNNH
jgi:hypothetical protein